MVNVGGVEIDPTIIFGVAGAVGGLLRTINWKIENPTEAFDPWKLGRNVIIGGVCGYVVDTSYLNAFTAGLTGEWIVQNVLSKVDDKVGVSKSIPQVKSLVQ